MPEHWEVVKLGIAAEVIMGQSPPGDSYNNNGIGVPLINGPAEFGGRFPKVFKSTSKPTKICEIGDILFCVRGNTTGRMNVADSKYCIGRGVAAIRGKQSCSQTSYLFYFLEREEQSILSRASAGGSTFPNITKAQLEGLITLHPPLTEQQKIACILSSVDHKIEVEEKKKLSLQVLFKTMLHLLMTGQVRVNSK